MRAIAKEFWDVYVHFQNCVDDKTNEKLQNELSKEIEEVNCHRNEVNKLKFDDGYTDFELLGGIFNNNEILENYIQELKECNTEGYPLNVYCPMLKSVEELVEKFYNISLCLTLSTQ